MLLKLQMMIDIVERSYANFLASIIKKPWDVWLQEDTILCYGVDVLFEDLLLELDRREWDKWLVRDKLLSNFMIDIPNAKDEHVKTLENIVNNRIDEVIRIFFL